MVLKALEENPGPVKQYLEGKQTLLGFFIGQVMRASQGKADPRLVRKLLKARLDEMSSGRGQK
jgi:aspartyl-tRNA(Asn)/glutamyl-tRNA(Gln) amidotransferase subunit B